MYKLLVTVFGFTGLILGSTSLKAAEPVAIDVPAMVKENIFKRHPKAVGLEASPENHFGKDMIGVQFKEEDVLYNELFRLNGKFFINKLIINEEEDVPSDILESLKKEFPEYEFKKAALSVNPDGIGQEYDLYIISKGGKWKVVIDGQGKMISKEQVLIEP